MQQLAGSQLALASHGVTEGPGGTLTNSDPLGLGGEWMQGLLTTASETELPMPSYGAMVPALVPLTATMPPRARTPRSARLCWSTPPQCCASSRRRIGTVSSAG